MTGPLADARHELFAQAVASGNRLQAAYELAGFVGKDPKLSWKLRHRAVVDARVRELLQGRVQAQTRSFVRRQKSKGDLLQRALKELEAIAFHDVREVAAWRREPVLNPDGEVTGYRNALAIRDSADLTPEAAKAIKSAFTKGGEIRIDMHDKRQALEAIIKILTKSEVPAAGSVTINQTNVGQMSALETAKRVHFLLAASQHAQATAAPLIDAQPVRKSEDTDVPTGS